MIALATDISGNSTRTDDLIGLLYSIEVALKKSTIDKSLQKFQPETLSLIEQFTTNSANLYRLEAILSVLKIAPGETPEATKSMEAALATESEFLVYFTEIKTFTIDIYHILLKKQDPQIDGIRYLIELNLASELKQLAVLKTIKAS